MQKVSKNLTNIKSNIPFERNCPKCAKSLFYRSKKKMLRALSNNGLCRSCAARERKVDGHKYPVKNDFFRKIDSEEKAYWFGFLCGDGCITSGGNYSECNTLSLNLSIKDKEHVFKLRDILSPSRPILYDTMGGHGRACLRIYDKLLCSDLIFHDMTPRKSFTLKMPILEKQLLRHFWRGMVDADGWIGKKDSLIGLCGTFDMVSNFTVFIKEELHFDVPKIRKAEKIYSFNIKGKKAQKVAVLLYKNTIVSLDRKMNLYLNLISTQIKEQKSWRHLTKKGLESLHIQFGSWKEVARNIGIHIASLHKIKKKLGTSLDYSVKFLND